MIGFRGMIHLYVLSVTCLRGVEAFFCCGAYIRHRRHFKVKESSLTFRFLPECRSS